jgi:hypothetical protein
MMKGPSCGIRSGVERHKDALPRRVVGPFSLMRISLPTSPGQESQIHRHPCPAHSRSRGRPRMAVSRPNLTEPSSLRSATRTKTHRPVDHPVRHLARVTPVPPMTATRNTSRPFLQKSQRQEKRSVVAAKWTYRSSPDGKPSGYQPVSSHRRIPVKWKTKSVNALVPSL